MKYTVVPLISYQLVTTAEHECDKSGALSHYLQKYIDKCGNILTNIWGLYSESGKNMPLGVVEAASLSVDQLRHILINYLFVKKT